MPEDSYKNARKDLNIIDFRPHLSDTTFQYLRNCYLKLKEEDYFASAIWGSVFLEAFLSELIDQLGAPLKGSDDLYGQIKTIRKYRPTPDSEQLGVPKEIVTRCDQIRNIRNLLVHHTGFPKKTLSHDSKSIWNHLQIILDWYLNNISRTSIESVPEKTSKESDSTRIPVFISSITPHNEIQVYFLEMFCNRLKEIGIQPVRLKASNFDKRDPIGKVRSLIETCHGLIAVGLERSHAYFLRDKEGSKNEEEETHRKYTSSWLHIEAGIANALGKDIFVLCEEDICSEGIFDRNWNTYIVNILKTLDEDSAELEDFLNHLKKWVDLQRQHLDS